MSVAYFQIVRVLWKSDTIPGHTESRNQQHMCGCKFQLLFCSLNVCIEIIKLCLKNYSDLRNSNGPSANSSTMGQLRARRKAAKMLVAVVLMFAGCYFPVHLLNILR